MGIGRGARRPWPSLDFENFSKNDCFLSFEWEKTKFATFDSPRKILEKSPSTPLKNPSDGHVHVGPLGLYFSTLIAYLRYKMLLI